MGHIQGDTLVDLDSDPSNILKVVRLGKQLLMTRGAITTFSIANDAFPHMCIFQLYI
jgi:potassium-transporting ATPase ATP-binding subunit